MIRVRLGNLSGNGSYLRNRALFHHLYSQIHRTAPSPPRKGLFISGVGGSAGAQISHGNIRSRPNAGEWDDSRKLNADKGPGFYGAGELEAATAK